LLLLFTIWTVFIASMVGILATFARREAREIALNRAMDSYHKDLAYRRWAAERGGVYVPLNAKTPPNPYLAHLPNRDVTTLQGQRLTLVNPAYMTRMVHELGDAAYGLKGHITSLRPLRPENAPDAWERKALEAFEHGADHYSEATQEQGQRVLRFMGVFRVEPSCLLCHAQQGYKVGEVRGGISVTVPIGTGPQAVGLSHWGLSISAMALFWLLGGGAGFLWWKKRTAFELDQHRMLTRLGQSAKRFQQLFETSPAPMFIHQSGQVLFVNTAAAHLMGAQDPEELKGREILSCVHPESQSRITQRVEALLATGIPQPPDVERFITLQGQDLWVEVQGVPMDLPSGPAILGFARDLTEQRRAEEERHRLEVEIQHAQKLDSLGSLAGGIAHDMNNVLAAVLGLSSALQATHREDDALVKSLKTIENAASRGRDLVKGLTDFARKGLHEPKVMGLNALIRKDLDLLVRTSRQRFTFQVDLQVDLPPILGEESSLSSAFMNICVNAFDAMPGGGTLGVRTWEEGTQVKLLVADTGAGIPPEILHRVTEPFFTTKPAGRGTGLGLAMVYGTMKAHGGTLDIQSEVGRGTSITLTLPMATAVADTQHEAPESVLPSVRSLRILVVDDDELIRSMLPEMLARLGHQTEVASSALDAIRRLGADLDPDLVILDHNMPGMSGGEALPRMFQLRPNLQVLVSTGFLDDELRLLLADFPSVRAIQKPYALAELQRIISAVFQAVK
jgi:PAS domain S-box-containing protein